ncbi:MAG: ABC transporter permease subunit [Lacrimispora sp.]|uniref:ABC transporter permease n=1 Tax=Lacrimispora sp. TaxID=2719234 RepID=UPI0039E61460
MKKKLMPYLLLAPQIILTVLFMIGLITGITQSLGVIPAFGLKEPTLFYYKEVLSRPDMIHSLLYSLRIALISAVLATAGGVFFCCVCVARQKNRGMMMRIVQLPIIIPHVMAALFILNIFSRNGILARIAYALGMIQEQVQFPLVIYDSHGIGIILAYLWKEIPFIIYFVISLMANINGSLGEAAVNLGAGPLAVFWKVTLPLCRNTIVSGFLIIFVFALGAYELPLLLGATLPKALPVLAYQQYIHPDLRNRPYAMALNGIIIAVSLLSALLYFLMMQKNMKDLTDEAQI